MPSFDSNDCSQVFARLDDWADRELSPEDLAAIDAHLDTCSHCGDEFRFEARTLTAIRGALGRLEVPAGLKDRVLAKLHRSAG